MSDKVKAGLRLLPTLPVKSAFDKTPMFLEKRIYQGSGGAVYPHPVIDRIFDDRDGKSYIAPFHENRYLKIMTLFELGGRVQIVLDKEGLEVLPVTPGAITLLQKGVTDRHEARFVSLQSSKCHVKRSKTDITLKLELLSALA